MRFRMGAIGVSEADAVERHLAAVREKRLEIARKNDDWTEIPLGRLVPRGPRGRYLVDEETDQVYTLRGGQVFASKSAQVSFVSERDPLCFFVDRDGEVRFLERPFARRSWSEIYAGTLAPSG